MATKEGSKCVQIDFVSRNLTGSEDCLYLNVYTPFVSITAIIKKTESQKKVIFR